MANEKTSGYAGNRRPTATYQSSLSARGGMTVSPSGSPPGPPGSLRTGPSLGAQSSPSARSWFPSPEYRKQLGGSC